MNRIDDYVIIEEGINKAAKEQYDKAQSSQFSYNWDLRTQEIAVEKYQQASYKEKRDIIINYLISSGEPHHKGFRGLVKGLGDFETLLYATNKFYRDHFFHTFQVWGL